MKTYLIELQHSTPIHVKANSAAEARAWCESHGLGHLITGIHDDSANV